MSGSLGLYGAILNFVGGAALSWEALTVKRVKAEIGARHLREIFQQAGLGDRLVDSQGRPLKDDEDLALGLAGRSLPLARFGFVLMTLGFLLEILSFWINPSGAPPS